MSLKELYSLQFSPPVLTSKIFLGEDLWKQEALFCDLWKESEKRIILIEEVVYHHYQKNLSHLFPTEEWIIVPGGEGVKTSKIKQQVDKELIQRKCNRYTHLVAIGGGSLLDLAGYVAATYCRGIAHSFFPTTLLAMTDASIGGKCAINMSGKKNWLGSFHPAQNIFIDLTFLQTLPFPFYLDGLVECLKHGLVGDSSLFSLFEAEKKEILNGSTTVLEKVLRKSIQVKKNIVEQDPYDQNGKRALLNFGHTVGHALESLSKGHLSHGQAVAMGMWVEICVSKEKGILPSSTFDFLRSFFSSLPFPFSTLSLYKEGVLYEKMQNSDKKSCRNTPYFISLEEIGKGQLLALDSVSWEKGYGTALRPFS